MSGDVMKQKQPNRGAVEPHLVHIVRATLDNALFCFGFSYGQYGSNVYWLSFD